jgi:hypothetical protein
MKKLFYCVLTCLPFFLVGCKEKEPDAPKYVDLGLSVKWATCNVGAISAEEVGEYFAWGETESKEFYDWTTYKWCEGEEDTQTKYCSNASYGKVDKKEVLELADDAANVKLGGKWRVPTTAEFDELKDKCMWVWTNENGVYGYKVISSVNAKSIFLPATGYVKGVKVYDEYASCYYWSNQVHTRAPFDAYAFYVSIDGDSFWSRTDRYYGVTIRPVYVDKK